MQLIIDIPDKVIAHIRSAYGHGYKGLYDEDKSIIVDSIYNAIEFQKMIEEIKAEIGKLPKQSYFVSSDGTMGGYRERCTEDYEVDVLNIIDKRIDELKGENNE